MTDPINDDNFTPSDDDESVTLEATMLPTSSEGESTAS